MSITVQQLKQHLTGMLHGGTLNKVRNIESAIERACNTLLSKVDPVDTMREVPLTQTVHDDLFNYSLPSDYKKAIDLIPQDNRNQTDNVIRHIARTFDLKKEIADKTVSIEGSEGNKFLRLNWKNRQGKVLHSMNSVTENGTWFAIGTASSITTDSIIKYSGTGSIRFTSNASGDGIQNTTMRAVDLSNENGVADVHFQVYLPTTTGITSIRPIWGNDLNANYWSGVAQTTQADGTAFRTGWNTLSVSWSGATQTGTVNPATIDSFGIIIVTTGSVIQNIRVDNIIFSIGRAFNIKYYSKYCIKNSSGTWIPTTTDDSDIIVLDSDAINGLLYECLIECAQQIEGSDSTFDINFAQNKLYGNKNSAIAQERVGFYQLYKSEYPSQSKKAVRSFFNTRNPNR